MTNRLDATFDPTAAHAALATLRAELPFLQSLSVEDKRNLAKLGDKSRAFVQKALNVAQQNPDILPRTFDVEDLQKDWELYQNLYGLLQDLTRLFEQVEDTCTIAGAEAYAAALVVYTYTKAAGDESLEDVADDLGKRFSRRNPRSQPPAAN